MKKPFILIAALLLATYAFAQTTSFSGSVPYQSGLTLTEAEALATVSAEEAVAAAEAFAGVSSPDALAELTVINDFLAWSVALGDQTVYVDIGNSQNISLQTNAITGQMTAGDDDDDNDYEHSGGDHEDHEGSEHEGHDDDD